MTDPTPDQALAGTSRSPAPNELDGPYGAGDHGDDTGHDDAHAEDALGPIDAPAWIAGLGGVGLGLAVVVCLALATGRLG